VSGRPSEERDSRRYVLRLYVAGATAASVRAIEAIRRICAEQLEGRYELEVLDIYQLPEQAKAHDVVAVPTLIRQLPEPLRILVGDLSDVQRVLVALDLEPATKP
jgi:circadian clock protein KaiB